MAERVQWVAGPVAYNRNDTYICWDFFGQTETGSIRRWRLNYDINLRKFRISSLQIKFDETRNNNRLADLYRPVSIPRDSLPKGAILNALKAMLIDEDIATATSASLMKGRQ